MRKRERERESQVSERFADSKRFNDRLKIEGVLFGGPGKSCEKNCDGYKEIYNIIDIKRVRNNGKNNQNNSQNLLGLERNCSSFVDNKSIRNSL